MWRKYDVQPSVTANYGNGVKMTIQDIKNRIIRQDQVRYMFSCPPEWEELIVQLDKDLAAIDPDYQVQQVKEKFGGLRYYFGTYHSVGSWQRERMQNLVFKAEEASFALLDWNND